MASLKQQSVSGFKWSHLGYNPFSFNHGFLGYLLAPVFSMLMLYVLLAFIRLMKKNKYTSKLFGFKISLK